MKNIPLLLGTIFGTLLLVLGVAVFFSNSAPQGADTAPVDQALVLGEDPHIYGPENAPITIVEFSDFQCPACQATAPFIKQVMSQYPNEVRLVYRHFPLSSIHPYAQVAAEASEIAAAEGKFWEYHDLLFERFDDWTKLKSNDEVQTALVGFAGELGIDTTQFKEKIQSGEYRDAVLADVSVANSLTINGTPTLFVNGQRLSAPNQLPEVIEALLAGMSDQGSEDSAQSPEQATEASQASASASPATN